MRRTRSKLATVLAAALFVCEPFNVCRVQQLTHKLMNAVGEEKT
jgi:hypothetical protein